MGIFKGLLGCLVGCLVGSFVLLFFSSCGERYTGGSDDVDNPALAIALRDPNGQSIPAARIQVFAAWQNPLQDSLPLLTLNAEQGKDTLTDTQLVAAMREAQVRGIAWPSADTIAFNLIARSNGNEAFESGYLLLRTGESHYRFYREVRGSLLSGEKNVLSTTATLADASLQVRGDVGEAGKALRLNRAFIAGSDYQAPIDGQGTFTFARMAAGSFHLNAAAEDGKIYAAPNALVSDSAGVYQAQDWTEADVIWIAP